MDSYLYTCHYCGKDYIPKRRYKQRFCSNSCRVNSFNRKKQTGLSVPQKEIAKEAEKDKPKPLKIEKMSVAGVANAAAGTVAVNLLTSLLTSDENKPVTKKDLITILGQNNKRFHPVRNAQFKLGYTAFYDMQTQTIVYQRVVSHGR